MNLDSSTNSDTTRYWWIVV